MNRFYKNLPTSRINLYLIIVGVIAVSFFVLDIFTLFYNKKTDEEFNYYSNIDSKKPLNTKEINQINLENINVLVISDSHLNSDAFTKVRTIAEKNNVSLIVHLGDHTDYGSEQEILTAKSLVDSLKINYVALPGDRDLAYAGNNSLFYKYFKSVSTLSLNKLNLLFIDNSPNFTPLSDDYLNSMIKEVASSNIIFLSQPIFVEKGNIFENKYMGSLNAFNFDDLEKLNQQKNYLTQRNKLLNEIRTHGNKLVVSGDHHRSSQFLDPQNDTVKYLINGATAEYISSNGITIKQKSFQSQRVSIISVDKNLNYTIHEIELDEE